MLKRTLHSIRNRTPKELLTEIILVNDNSTLPELYEPLTDYVKETFGALVMIREMKERRGMIHSRMDGARFASGKILVSLTNYFFKYLNKFKIFDRFFLMLTLKLMLIGNLN